MSANPIYVDHHATTPVDPRVLEAMLPWFTEKFGNPASIQHAHGREAATAVEEARSVIADFFHVRPGEVFFTAGATEANNIALGLARTGGRHLIVSAIEHKSVLVPAEKLRAEGVEVTVLRPDSEGYFERAALEDAFRPGTSLVSIMAANGEIGTIEPIAALATLCRERGVLFHTDATQAAGKIPLDFSSIPADLVSFSAHKAYGPKGIGGLLVRRGVRPEPVVAGGGQERGLRAGTVNVPGVIGMAAAFEICRSEMAEEGRRLAALRDRLREGILAAIPGSFVNGPSAVRLPGNLNVSFERVDAESLILAMRGFSLSSGSACSSGDREPSHVLRAIGVGDAGAVGSIRFGLGRSNTGQQVELLISDLKESVSRLREIAV